MTVGVGAGGARAVRVLSGHPLPAALRALPHRLSDVQWQEPALLAVALVAVIALRGSFIPWAGLDYTTYLSHWFGFLQVHGFAGLGQEFADYNPPYLYLLWIGTLTGLPGLVWVKLLAAGADLALAAGAFRLLRQLDLSRFVAAGSAVLVLLLPEVLLNSAVWGQADSLFTALLVWALVHLVRGRPTAAWSLFALALSFKLQAVFVLPALVLALVVQRHRARALLVAAAVFAATYLPSLAAGRSVASLLAVYGNQGAEYRALTSDAASLYAWLPDAAFSSFRRAGVLFALATAAVLLAVLIRRFRTAPLTGRSMLLVTALFALLVPFTLPAMHERYFFTGDVLLFLLAVDRRRYLIAALVAQVIAVQTYTHNLFGGWGFVSTIPTPLLVVAELGLVVALLWPLVVGGRAAATTPLDPGGLRREPAAPPPRSAAPEQGVS